VEIALIDVIPGQEEAFAGAYQKAHRLLTETPGCIEARMTRGVETPTRFVGIVHWESVEHHLTNFRDSERYSQYAQLLGKYLAKPPVVEHFTPLGNGSF
jgi:heme-degrading monooxygenase HmoA